MKNNYKIVTYKGKKYIVAIDNNGDPFIFDFHVLEKLPNNNFYKHNTGYIYCRPKNLPYPLSLHHIIKPYNGKSIDHINQIKTDNREVNLRYASQTIQNKNQSKKKRNIILPTNCNINPQDIPTFIWYIKESKESGGHGDRWMVEIKHKYSWKSTSSKLLSTKCKFELAKQHLRQLIQNRPELFNGHCINGELSEEGANLKHEFIEILKLVNIDYVEHTSKKYLLKEDISGLEQYEIEILNGADITNTIRKYNIKKPIFYQTEIPEESFQPNKTETNSNSPTQIQLPNEILLEIINLYFKNMTTEEASKEIKKKFGVTLKRNIVSQIWKGELRFGDLVSHPDYQKMIQDPRKRVIKRKFTNEELEFLRTCQESLTQCCEEFKNKFDKNVSREYVSKLKNKASN